MDIKGFFESISEIQVYNSFLEFGYQPLVSFELARIVTIESSSNERNNLPVWKVRKPNKVIHDYNTSTIGYLPQGAPTSPMISNIVMRKLDARIQDYSEKFGLVYTRYSDDMTFSTLSKHFNRKKATEFIGIISKELSKDGFHQQYRKTKIVPPGARKVVLGLIVNDVKPRLTKKYKDNIRLHLYFLNQRGSFNHCKVRNFSSIEKMRLHVLGLINFAKMIEPEFAQKMYIQFNRIVW